MPDTIDTNEPRALPPPRRPFLSRTVIGGGALVAVLIAGAALGAGGTRLAQNWQPKSVLMLQPAPIDKMKESNVVAIKGEVAELFGNKFIVQDGSGRALVDTGPRGESRMVAVRGETLTVQGRFDRGIVRAEVVTHADGRNEAFGPPGPPDGPKGPKGPKDGFKDGPKDARADRGPPAPPAGERANLADDDASPRPR